MRFSVVSLTVCTLAFLVSPAWAASGLAINNLQCEYRTNPEGIDVARPRLSWSFQAGDAKQRGQRQTAYQILVASEPSALADDRGDFWDSGKVQSDQSLGVVYSGKPLASHQRCFWKVRVWDQDGRASPWSEPARWTVGVLDPKEWRGQWLRYVKPVDQEEDRKLIGSTLVGVQWIWFPEGDPTKKAPAGKRYFRKVFDLPSGAVVRDAEIVLTADERFTLYVNGKQAGKTGGENEAWRDAKKFDLTKLLVHGRNCVAIEAENLQEGPAGLAAKIFVQLEKGEPVNAASDASWSASQNLSADWEQPGFDDSQWKKAQALGPIGMAPWGEISVGGFFPWMQKAYSPIFRKAFEIKKPLKRATVYVCGLGYYELRLNGKKVGDRVLDPTFTQYDQRALYATYEVADQLIVGKNALGVMLGGGFLQAQRCTWLKEPMMFCQLRLEYADGAVETVASDSTWRASTGPLRHDGVHLGDDYDARREMPGWDTADFDDSAWASPTVVDGPKGKFSAETSPPIRVMQTIAPVGMSEPKPGVYVFDMGQNFAGWAQLKVAGPAGTRVSLRYGERIRPDGSLDQENIAVYVHNGPFQTDFYTLKGQGEEVWEPRFTYHGFRWVEVAGFPGKPTLENIRGRVVHTSFAPAGNFECSNELLNKIQRMTLWTYRSNFVGIPTDCPQREKSGWTGDAHLSAEQAMFNFQNVAAYEAWMTAFKDEQRPGGELPCIIPAYDWCYGWGNGPAWDSAYFIIPWHLYQYYGDVRVLEEHFDGQKRYVDYLRRRSKDFIVDFGLGDWLPAKTETRVAITSTGYFYRDALLVSKCAKVLGKEADAKTYADLAEKIRQAFQKQFIQGDGVVNNGSQTALSCALYQGLAAPEQRGAVLQRLAKNVEDRNGHLDTGILGAKYLFRALSDNGRHDLACRVALQTTPPSYGSWIERGATTLWEDWGDGFSRNHVAFGDISAWMVQYLAGINSDTDQPAFKHVLLRPRPVQDLTFVNAWHDSPYGRIESRWKIEKDRFHWRIVVPPNSTAAIYVPAGDPSAVLEGGKPASQAEGIQFLRQEEGCSVYKIGSGTYEFSSPVRR